MLHAFTPLYIRSVELKRLHWLTGHGWITDTQLGQLLRMHDTTHHAVLMQHEYVDLLERNVDQLRTDTLAVRRRIVMVSNAAVRLNRLWEPWQ